MSCDYCFATLQGNLLVLFIIIILKYHHINIYPIFSQFAKNHGKSLSFLDVAHYKWALWSNLIGHVTLLAITATTYPGLVPWGWVGLWGFLWWAPSAKGKDHHRVSSGWSSVWHRSNTGLSSTQYEQMPIILGVWPFWLTPFFFRSITFWRAYG